MHVTNALIVFHFTDALIVFHVPNTLIVFHVPNNLSAVICILITEELRD